MFGYAPTVNDRSGEFLAAGQVGAAQTNAQAMGQMGQDIGGALTSLAAAYGQRQGTISKGKNFKKFMGMAGGAFGLDESKLGMFNDMEDYDAGMMLDNFGSWMPAMANAQLGKQRAQDAGTRMYEQETLRRERDTINNPPAPAPVTVPQGMRRFNAPATTN
jgi:hypothetical protein